ncbi:uncharacterized protein SOCE26_066100 [Sorangium cellulosum]|uniref:Metallo-beta-lactamase domain-containing protein n=1 Tax=Sorangium cellulosum TaxID=56 RepID=A0A2L0F0X4_SORCE|nr:hypothetical protein [Sorangium cellulosum]AUX45129.1 uncharacterized protein SOCE26_066100 [Sorangium cellulosum]
MLPPSEPLDRLTALDPQRLYVFVVGPGRGEALAVRLPEVGWLLVDCCRVRAADGSDVLPQQALVARFPAPIAGALLTHPHEDHVDGFAELITALVPERVMVSGGDPPHRHLLDAVEARLSDVDATPSYVVAQQVKQAAMAIRQWEARNRRAVTPLHAATTLWPGPVGVFGRAPDTAAARPLLESGNVAARANELSAVLEIQWGSTRVVLGGDLPRVTTSRRAPASIASGWDLVMAQRPELGDHTALKIPHHASWAAMHLSLLRPAPDRRRGWLVTPLHKGKNHLPSLNANDGLDLLHLTEPLVMVTREPRVQTGQERWSLPALRAAIRTPATGIPLVDRGKRLSSAAMMGPLDAAWGIELDDTGRIVARYRGQAAFDVVPGE